MRKVILKLRKNKNGYELAINSNNSKSYTHKSNRCFWKTATRPEFNI